MKTFGRTFGAFVLSGALVFSGAGSAFAADTADESAADAVPVQADAGLQAGTDTLSDAVADTVEQQSSAIENDAANGMESEGASSVTGKPTAPLRDAGTGDSGTDGSDPSGDGDTGEGSGDGGSSTGSTKGGETGGTGDVGEGSETPSDDPQPQPQPQLQPKQQTTPKLKFAATTTFDSITVAAAPVTKEGAKPQYSLNGKTWQKSTKFKKLKAGTAYTVYVQWPKTGEYAAIAKKAYGKTTTKYVKISKLASKSYSTKKKNIVKGRKRCYVKVTLAYAKGVKITYRYKASGTWSKWQALESGKKSASLKALGKLSAKKRTVAVEVRAFKGSKRVGYAYASKKGMKTGAYKLDNIGELILESALKYTTPNYYYLMSGYDRYPKYSSKRTTGIDCSGLVSCALRDLGNALYTEYGYQVSTEIAANSKKVSGKKRGIAALKTAKPGDAIYWGEYGHWIGSGHNAFRHICFYAGKIDGVHYIIDSYPWSSGSAGYDYCKKLAKNPSYKGKKNKFHHGVNLRPITKREQKQIRSIHRFY